MVTALLKSHKLLKHFTFFLCSTFPPYCSTSVCTIVTWPLRAAHKMAVNPSCRQRQPTESKELMPHLISCMRLLVTRLYYTDIAERTCGSATTSCFTCLLYHTQVDNATKAIYTITGTSLNHSTQIAHPETTTAHTDICTNIFKDALGHIRTQIHATNTQTHNTRTH